MKTSYPIQVIDLRLQIDYVTPKKIRLFGEHGTALEFFNRYVILIKSKELKLASDGNKKTGVALTSELILSGLSMQQVIILSSKDFLRKFPRKLMP